MTTRSAQPTPKPARCAAPQLPGQVVLVLQGGGALGAYQLGVFQALHQAGIAPDWVIGTSIGAINAALIVGNAPGQQLLRLQAFWQRVQQRVPHSPPAAGALAAWGLANLLPNMATVVGGLPGFFAPNPRAWQGVRADVGVEQAAYYSTQPLRDTLLELVDFERLAASPTRLTVGAVNANTGAMRYFDSRRQRLGLDHIMASGALPPAFPAVRIDGEPYWDGGICSNTPIEAVLDDQPRRDSLIFSIDVWHASGPEPTSIGQVLARHKDIQFASRSTSHIERHRQLHRLRHVIAQLGGELPADCLADPHIRELTAWGCRTTMHVAHLVAPRLPGEDSSKDIDFTPAGIQARQQAGLADMLDLLERAPWRVEPDPIEGVVEYR